MAKRKGRTRAEEGSLADMADSFLKKVIKLAKSNDPSERILAFNAFLAVLVLAFSMSFGFIKDFKEMLSVILLFVVFTLLAAVVAIGYLKLLTAIKTMVHGDYFALKFGTALVWLAVMFSGLGFFFSIRGFIVAAVSLLLGQLLIVLFLGYLKIPVEQKAKERPSSFSGWGLLNRIDLILGIISSLITIGGLIISLV